MATYRKPLFLIASLLATALPAGLWVAPAHAADPAVAKVVAAPASDSNEPAVTVKFVVGTMFNNDNVDVFVGSTKLTGTLKATNIDMFLPGDEVKISLKLSKKAKLTGAYLATPGAFKDLAAVTKAAGGAATATTKPAPASTLPPAKCPLTQAELERALGLKFGTSSTVPSPFAGGMATMCSFQTSAGTTIASLNVSHFTWNTKKDFDTQYASFKANLVGKVTPIPGDKDKAGWSDRVTDGNVARLEYQRGLTHTSLILSGTNLKVDDLKARLLKVRRLP